MPPGSVRRAEAFTATGSERDPHTAVRLPPAIEAFLLVLIGSANLDRKGAVEFMDYRRYSRRDQLLLFKSYLKEIVRIYKHPKRYVGPPIYNLAQYVKHREPTRVFTGSLRGDMEALFDRMRGPDRVKPAVVTEPKDFGDTTVQMDAELFEFDKAERLHKIVEGIVGNGDVSPTIVASILSGALGVAFSTRGTVSLLRSVEDHLGNAGAKPAVPPVSEAEVAAFEDDNSETALTEDELDALTQPDTATGSAGPTMPPGLSKSQRKKWRREHHLAQLEGSAAGPLPVSPAPSATPKPAPAKVEPAKTAAPNDPAPTAPPSVTSAVGNLALGTILSAPNLGNWAGKGADALEAYQRLAESEGRVVAFLDQLEQMQTADQARVLAAFHRQLHDVVLPQIYRIGTAAAESPELRALAEQDPRVHGLIKVFFDEYLQTLPSDVLKDIILDLMRAPLETTDYQSLSIVLTHLPPMAQQFFQTVSKKAGLGSFANMFKKIRDDSWEVPLDQIQRIIDEDVNKYPLSNIRLSGKAGKLFQMVYADYDNGDGTKTPVAVRVLKPGVEKLLDAERVVLRRLAAQLSAALQSKNGRGPSKRRLEELIEMLYAGLREELRIDVTVQNHNDAAERLNRQLEVNIAPFGKSNLDIYVPKAYPARPESQVMVMELVSDVPNKEILEQYYPSLPKEFMDALVQLTSEELLVTPMQAAVYPEKFAHRPGAQFGFMHGDLHSGNFLLRVPKTRTAVPRYSAALIDLGLVIRLDPDQVREIMQLCVGASYNSIPFITEALWNLRDVNAMGNVDDRQVRRARHLLETLVTEEVKELNRSGKYRGPAEWVTLVWEDLDEIALPSWLISLEQGFHALRASYDDLWDANDKEADKIRQREWLKHETRFTQTHRDLIYQYMKKRLAGRKGWGTVYWTEAKNCVSRIFGLSRN